MSDEPTLADRLAEDAVEVRISGFIRTADHMDEAVEALRENVPKSDLKAAIRAAENSQKPELRDDIAVERGQMIGQKAESINWRSHLYPLIGGTDDE